MRPVGLLCIYVIASAHILAVDTYCAYHHTQKGEEAGRPSKSVLSKYKP